MLLLLALLATLPTEAFELDTGATGRGGKRTPGAAGGMRGSAVGCDGVEKRGRLAGLCKLFDAGVAAVTGIIEAGTGVVTGMGTGAVAVTGAGIGGAGTGGGIENISVAVAETLT